MEYRLGWGCMQRETDKRTGGTFFLVRRKVTMKQQLSIYVNELWLVTEIVDASDRHELLQRQPVLSRRARVWSSFFHRRTEYSCYSFIA